MHRSCKFYTIANVLTPLLSPSKRKRKEDCSIKHTIASTLQQHGMKATKKKKTQSTNNVSYKYYTASFFNIFLQKNQMVKWASVLLTEHHVQDSENMKNMQQKEQDMMMMMMMKIIKIRKKIIKTTLLVDQRREQVITIIQRIILVIIIIIIIVSNFPIPSAHVFLLSAAAVLQMDES